MWVCFIHCADTQCAFNDKNCIPPLWKFSCIFNVFSVFSILGTSIIFLILFLPICLLLFLLIRYFDSFRFIFYITYIYVLVFLFLFQRMPFVFYECNILFTSLSMLVPFSFLIFLHRMFSESSYFLFACLALYLSCLRLSSDIQEVLAVCSHSRQ